ncbi:MAG: kelch repeat-containing protein, partial [Flavobacteriales bacterium]
WMAKASFGGSGRRWAVGFSIDNYGYIGSGRISSSVQTKDFWEFDPLNNTWTQVADCGGGPRYGAVAFGIDTDGDGYNNYGFVATGMGNFGMYKNDLWQYDRNTNTWTAKAAFTGSARYWAMGFSIGTKGYVGTGSGNFGSTFSDFFEYDYNTDTWSSINAFPGGARYEGTAFSLDLDSNGVTDKGYAGTGYYFGTPYNDIYEYDPGTGNWTAVANVPGARHRATAFGIVNKGYLGLGCCPGMSNYYEFDRVNNTWTAQASYPGGNVYNAASFSIGCKGYTGTGFNGSSYLTSFFEFTPDACANILPIELLNIQVELLPSGQARVSWETATEINSCAFSVQRSADGREFEDIGRVEGMGFSDSRQRYAITDRTPLEGTSYYRLKQTDCNGSVSYSAMLPLHSRNASLSIYPNPASNYINIQRNGAKSETLEVHVADLNGSLVDEFLLKCGKNDVCSDIIDLKGLEQGMYCLRFVSSGTYYKPMVFTIIK